MRFSGKYMDFFDIVVFRPDKLCDFGELITSDREYRFGRRGRGGIITEAFRPK